MDAFMYNFSLFPTFNFSYHLVLEAISASINLVNWASVGKLNLKIDFFFFYPNAFSCTSFSCDCPSGKQVCKSEIQCICQCEAVQ